MSIDYDIQAIADVIDSSSQVCRFEKVPNLSKNVILDVCHNIDGFIAVINQVKNKYPMAKSVKLVLGISKTKKLNELIKFFEEEALIESIHIISRPHMRLYKIEDAHKSFLSLGCTKVHDLIGFNLSTSMIEGDTSDSSRFSDSHHVNNIGPTLDYVIDATSESPDELVLVCGSFFIMSDVRCHLGIPMITDSIM